MSVLVCAGKLTFPIKYSSDKLGISGVSYVEKLEEYLKYNKHIEKVIFLETKDNVFNEEDVKGFDGEFLFITTNISRYQESSSNSPVSGVEESNIGEPPEEGSFPGLTQGTLQKVVGVKELEGLRVSDIQWEIMMS